MYVPKIGERVAVGDVLAGLKPYQSRVVEEKRQLDDNIKKLESFLDGKQEIAQEELDLLMQQLAIMKIYSMILDKRIQLWKKP